MRIVVTVLVVVTAIVLAMGVGYRSWNLSQVISRAFAPASQGQKRVMQDSTGVAGHRASEEDLIEQVHGMVERVTAHPVVYRFAYGPEKARPATMYVPSRDLITTFSVGIKPQGADDRQGICVSIDRLAGESMDDLLGRVERELRRKFIQSSELTRNGYRTCDPR